MGRVMVPVSLLTHESYCGWIPLGRTSTRDAQFTGEIYLELRIKSQLVRLCYIIIMFAEISLILFSDHNCELWQGRCKLDKILGCLYDPGFPARDGRWDDFNVLKYITWLKRNFKRCL